MLAESDLESSENMAKHHYFVLKNDLFVELDPSIFHLFLLWLCFANVKFSTIAQIVKKTVVKIKLSIRATLESGQKSSGASI